MPRLQHPLATLAFSFAVTVALAAHARLASACGGTFCDAGPQAMPVDQTGENILFVMDGGYTEAHIQIQYDPETEADNFAWVIPVTVVPEFEVGSELLFTNMLAGTVPRYGVQTNFDACGSFDGADGEGDPSPGILLDAGSGNGPDVLFEASVGAFDIVVLAGGGADELMGWLGDNGYQQDPAAEPVIAEYLAQGMFFAAFKLRVGEATSAIHPVVLRFPDTDEACIPIRLTRIAAAENMDIRAFFLAEHRVVPQNYRHVLVNPLKIDWPNFAANYKEVITLAVDADHADGRAFVTEYAGPSDVVGRFGLGDSAWDASVFADLTRVQALAELRQQGLLQCAWQECTFGHPLVEGLLAQYLPAPAGVPNQAWWACPLCYVDKSDAAEWDAAGFATAMAQRVVEPARHGAAILDGFPYLTRMYTTLSPGEMTVDPLFHQNASLPDVAAVRTATQRVLCNADEVWTLPDGREVYRPAGSAWPRFPEHMPWEEDIEQMPADGAPLNVVDRTAEIDALLAAYNAGFDWRGEGKGGDGGGTTGGDGPGVDHAGLDDGGGRASGCGCGASDGPRLGWAMMLGLALLGAVRRRAGATP